MWDAVIKSTNKSAWYNTFSFVAVVDPEGGKGVQLHPPFTGSNAFFTLYMAEPFWTKLGSKNNLAT